MQRGAPHLSPRGELWAVHEGLDGGVLGVQRAQHVLQLVRLEENKPSRVRA